MSSNQIPADRGQSRIRIAGEVNANGKRISGGAKLLFRARHVTAGQYAVSYNDLGFAPVVIASSTDHDHPAVVVVTQVNSAGFNVECFALIDKGRKKAGDFVNSSFSFIVAEP